MMDNQIVCFARWADSWNFFSQVWEAKTRCGVINSMFACVESGVLRGLGPVQVIKFLGPLIQLVSYVIPMRLLQTCSVLI